MKKENLIGINPNSRLLKDYKSSLTNLSVIQKEASIGILLGDASLQTQNKGKTYRLKFEWGDKNKDYTNHVYSLFNEWVLSEPHKKVRINSNGNKVVTWGFQTISHKAFCFLNDLFIIDGKKSVTPLLIKIYLTERGLAYWFMDDVGKLDYNLKSKNKSLVLNTQSFKESEVDTLKIELKNKFNLDCGTRINKNKKILVIKSNSYNRFLEFTSSYIIPEMKYKLP